MRAVLWDMDGTIVDSEKLWDVAINELYARHDRVLAPEIRDSTVGGSADGVIRIVFDDLGLDPDPAHMTDVADWMHDRVGELFGTGLPWCPGARELLDALQAADVPMALVTNTRRALTENALNSIGRHYFSAMSASLSRCSSGWYPQNSSRTRWCIRSANASASRSASDSSRIAL